MVNVEYIDQGFDVAVAEKILDCIQRIHADGEILISVAMYPVDEADDWWTGRVVYERREK